MRKGSKLFRCPDCKRMSVYEKTNSPVPGEDGYACRTAGCNFWAFTGGNYEHDLKERRRLWTANWERRQDIWLGDCWCPPDDIAEDCPQHGAHLTDADVAALHVALNRPLYQAE